MGIQVCENLRHLTSKEQMQRLIFFKELNIYDCPCLKERCKRDEEEWAKISHIPDIFIDQDSILSNIFL
ncbi:hypothetical protein Sjap_008172 [Stephania japonica]|uniref:Uncharacterized protein n=1 Tax=Stephania japonica TaxID=461633 RepID=A0AAP0JNZ8_9MAGN